MSDQKVLLSVCNKFVTEHIIIFIVKKAAFKTLDREIVFEELSFVFVARPLSSLIGDRYEKFYIIILVNCLNDYSTLHNTRVHKQIQILIQQNNMLPQL